MTEDAPSYAQEAKQQALLAAPVTITFLLNKSVNIVSVLVVGHLSPAELAAASLAHSLANVLGNSLIAGLASGLSTLCGQAYGAGNYAAVGLWALRAWMACMLTCLPLIGLWLSAEPLLLRVGQTAEVSCMTAAYLRLLIPGLLANSATTCMTYYLQSQGIVRPGAFSSCAVAVIHVPIIYLLVFVCDLRYLGAAMSVSLAYISQMLFLLSLILYLRLHEKTWPGLSRSCFEKWGAFLRLAIPSCLMMAEWWASEVTVMSAGLLPNAERKLSAMAIYQNTSALCFMVPVGLSVACSTRISNELGAQRPQHAKRAGIVAGCLAVLCMSVIGVALLLFKGPWSRLFTNDSQLSDIVQVVMVWLALYVVVDGITCTLSGLIRGTGKQGQAVWVVFVSYWVVGVPVALLMCFKVGLGVQGLCLGMIIGTAVHLAAYCWIGYVTDWQDEARKAAIRAEVKLELGAMDIESQGNGNASSAEASAAVDNDDESASLLQKSNSNSRVDQSSNA